MSYLKVKIYVKSRFNVLLLVYALKWCVLVLISYEALDIASKLWLHLIMVTRYSTFSVIGNSKCVSRLARKAGVGAWPLLATAGSLL